VQKIIKRTVRMTYEIIQLLFHRLCRIYNMFYEGEKIFSLSRIAQK